MIKLAAMDMDGTLLRSDKSISPYTRDVLRRAKTAGIVLVAASGRPEDSLYSCIGDVDGFSYAICSNGALILKLVDEEDCIRISGQRGETGQEQRETRTDAASQEQRETRTEAAGQEQRETRTDASNGCGESGYTDWEKGSCLGSGSVFRNSLVIRRLVMEKDSVDAVLEIIRNIDAPSECFVNGRSYTGRDYWEDAASFGATLEQAEYVHATRTPIDDIRNFISDHSHELDALDIITDYTELREKALRGLDEIDNIYITSSVDALVEISHKDSGKAAALAWLCSKLGIKSEEVIAFGNEENDREMLSWAGIGAAVSNSTESLLKDADVIAPDNDDDGVAKVLEELLR